VLGYSLGLIIAFTTARKYVFRSSGKIAPEGFRYVAAFMFCFLCNLVILQVARLAMGLNDWIAQSIAVSFYVVAMYGCSRFLVFSPIHGPEKNGRPRHD
jgi:putative flippase GtrA